MNVEYRPISNTGWLQRILYMAVGWRPTESLPPIELVVDHPYLRLYWEDWGRRGDEGVAVLVDGDFAGGAFFRLFTEERHGHGFVDGQTPEIAIAVSADHRGQGLGTELLGRLAAVAENAGYQQLSLSVDADNPAVALYQRVGYRELDRDSEGVRMVLQVGSGS